MPFLVNGVIINLKIDSGADVNVMSMRNFEAIAKGETQPLVLNKNNDVQLRDFGGNEIKCAGCVTTTIAASAAGDKLEETFHIAASRPQSVLCYETSTRLGVLKMTSTIMQVEAIKIFPTMPLEPIKLRINEEVMPRICIYNNIPAALEPFINDHWDKLEQRGVIEPVPDAPKWLSRVDVVPKKDGTYRVIIDMRPANKAIARKYYPMPNPDHLLSRMGNARFFAKFDLKSAYHHVLLHPASRYVTAFMTNKGARQFTRLPFGINCAPEIFQQIMDNTFGMLEGVLVYLDDVLVYAPDKETLRKRREAVMTIVKKNNLTLNTDKCVDEAVSVEFLGSILSSSGCLPVPERVNGIKNFARPKTYAELREFIGLVNYIAKHLYDISTIMEPMRRLLEGDSKSLKGAKLLENWEQEQEGSFVKTKEMVTKNILERGYYCRNHLTKITTDASPVGIAAIITQIDTSKPEHLQTERVIACTSRSLTKTERKYPQTQREALAITWGIDKNSYYLVGTKFVVVTDHEPLKYIFGNGARKSLSKRAVTRAESYAMRLSQYNFEVETVRSKENRADILSRCPATKTQRTLESTAPQCVITAVVGTISATPEEIVSRNSALTPEEVRTATSNDPQLLKVIQALKGDCDWDTEIADFIRFRKELVYADNLLMRGDRIVVPEKLQTKAMSVAHRSHPGMSTTKHLLRKYVWWPRMDRAVEEFVRTCATCIRLSTSDPPEPMLMSSFPNGPWQNISIDFWSGGDTDIKVLVAADYYSKAIRAETMKETTSEATIKVLEKVFDEWGWPESIKHDNGPQLVSDLFRGWMRSNGVSSLPTTPRNAQENGLVERHMKGITRAFAIAKIEKRRPEETLRQYVCDYNSWPHTVTQLAPRDVLMGRIVKTRFPLLEGTEKHHSFDSIARARDLTFKAKKKATEDRKRRAKPSNVKVGDKVYVRNHDRKNKTEANFSGEKHEVTARSGGRLTLKSLKDGVKKLRKTIDVKIVPENEHDGSGSLDNIQRNGTEIPTNQGPTAVIAISEPSSEVQSSTGRPQRVRQQVERFTFGASGTSK